MKLKLILATVLVAALGASATAQQAEDDAPAYEVVPPGTTFTCNERLGCLVMNKPLADRIGQQLRRCQKEKPDA